MIPGSIQAGIEATKLLNVGDIVLETSVGAIRCVDVNSKKSPIWSIGLYYANELENGVLVRRPLGIKSDQTDWTD